MSFDPQFLVGQEIEVVGLFAAQGCAGEIGDIIVPTYYDLVINSFNVRVYHRGVEVTGQRAAQPWYAAWFEVQLNNGTLQLIDDRPGFADHDSARAPMPKNNDGRTTCYACGAPTREYGAVGGLPAMGRVCTKCGK